nr:hypothetical protein [Candidatus Sigynarchaeum springense]
MEEWSYNLLASMERSVFSGTDGDSWLEAEVVVEPDARDRMIRATRRSGTGVMIYWYDADGCGPLFEVGFVFTSDSKANDDSSGDRALFKSQKR